MPGSLFLDKLLPSDDEKCALILKLKVDTKHEELKVISAQSV